MAERHHRSQPTFATKSSGADIVTADRHVSKVPGTEVATSFDHLIGTSQARASEI
jgi:hypothetical protein